jgi:putative ABC transport system permease protein
MTAGARLLEYTEITEDNRNSFHFHADPQAYPLSAVILVPNDDKSATILRGRHLADQGAYQLVVPETVVDGLLANIFRIKQVLDAVIAVVGLSTLLVLILVFALSVRLRHREFRTVARIGGSRLTVVRLLAAELGIILAASAALSALTLFAVDRYSDDLVRSLFVK